MSQAKSFCGNAIAIRLRLRLLLWLPAKNSEGGGEEIGGRWGEINTYLSLTGQLTRLAGDSHNTHSYKWIVPGTRSESGVRWGVSAVLGGYLMEGTAWHLRGTFWGSTAEYSNARNYPGHATRPTRRQPVKLWSWKTREGKFLLPKITMCDASERCKAQANG